jgi:TolB-like protein/DNA-binding winged helix-turn-helix (wHTH) protein
MTAMPGGANRVPDTNLGADGHTPPLIRVRRFGAFELDVRAGELHKDGLKIKLQGQPIEVLIALLECPGEIVKREELRQRLWPSDTFVDFEHNLNSAVKRLREALGDSADNPRFIETLPRHGYRFIAPVAEQVQPVSRRQFRVRPLWIAVLATATIVVLVVGLNMGDLRQRLFSRAAGEPIKSLAVLPLENLSGNPDEDYFAEGMTEELITELGRIRALRVISRQSVMQYKGTNKPLPQIARELHVGALVQGSALRAGGRVRITTQLIRAVPEEHLWAQSYERDLRDVIALQGEVARDIARQIRVTVSPQDQLAARPGPRDAQTYMLYLQARYFQQRLSLENLEKAIGYYTQLIKLDPDYAPAWAGLSVAQGQQTQLHTERGVVPTQEGYLEARQTAERALALEPNLVDAHVALAHIKLISEWDSPGADACMQRALALAPGDAAVLEGAAELAFTVGRFEEGLSLARKAVQLDPLNPAAFTGYGLIAYYAGRLEEAASAEKKALELYPNDFAQRLLAKIYLAQSRPQEALTEIAQDKERGSRLLMQALAHHVLGNKSESDAALAGLIALARQETWAYQVAEVYAFRGEIDQAFQWLERAYSERDGGLAALKGDPLLKSLERDPRYAAFVKRMHLPV